MSVDVGGVPIPVAKKNKNKIFGALIGGGGAAAVLLATPLAPFALPGGLAGFALGWGIGKAIG